MNESFVRISQYKIMQSLAEYIKKLGLQAT